MMKMTMDMDMAMMRYHKVVMDIMGTLFRKVVMHMEIFVIPMELVQVISEKVLVTLTAR